MLRGHMSAPSTIPDDGSETPAAETTGAAAAAQTIATDRDAAGVPVHVSQYVLAYV